MSVHRLVVRKAASMLRQYNCSPYTVKSINRISMDVGILPCGSIVRMYSVRRAPYTEDIRHTDTIIIEAWFPRDCALGRYDQHTQRWTTSYHATGMYVAQVRSLRNGRRYRLTDNAFHSAGKLNEAARQEADRIAFCKAARGA